MSSYQPDDPARYFTFWSQLLAKARLQTSLFRNTVAPSGPELSVMQGPARWSLVLSDDSALVALQVSEQSSQTPGMLASRLLDHRQQIELACGTRLVWRQTQSDTGPLCVIVWKVEDYGFAEIGDWPYLQDTLIAAIERLYRASRPVISGTGEPSSAAATEDNLERLAILYTHELINSYYVLGEETGYWANYFLRSVRQHGGVETTRRLLHRSQPSDGLEMLRQIRRLDISVEAYVLRPEFAPLFTTEELEIARRRLRDHGYPV